MSVDLELRVLTRRHRADGPAALDALDLEVPAGRCAALLGPSGSGKTTALRLAAGLDRPDGGDVLLGGRSVVDVPAERRGTAMVSQRPLLFPHLSVLDNVAFAARVSGTDRRRARADAAEHLALVQLGDLGARRPHELSGGQGQRVALARALAARPAVLLLDEPFSALDTALREDMHVLLLDLRAQLKPTVLLVTHDPVEATALADDVAVLHEGRLQQHGPVAELYTRPRTLRVARLLGGRNEVPGEVRAGVHRSPLGAVPVPGAADGPGVLLVRQEQVDLGAPDGPLTGTVTAVRPRGARLLVTVDAGAPVQAEVPVGSALRPGDRVGLVLGACTVVPAG